MNTEHSGIAQLMPGCPHTETGHNMPHASWYRLTNDSGNTQYVAVTGQGVYDTDPLGNIRDFFRCRYERRAVESQADALRHIGFEVTA